MSWASGNILPVRRSIFKHNDRDEFASAGMKRCKVTVLRAWVIAFVVFMCRSSMAQTLTPVDELHALTDFANSNGHLASNRRNLGNWRVGFDARGNWTGGNPCRGFKGVRCSGTGNIRILELPQSKLNGTISPALGKLPLLTRLNLAGNSLTGDITAAVAPLIKMKRLRLQDNQLTGSISNWIQNMVGLEKLMLANNALRDSIPAGLFSNLTALQVIDVSNNTFSGTIPDDLVKIPSLQRLSLRGNNFIGAVPDSLASSTSYFLNMVDLSGNALNGSLPAVWSLPNLTTLDLSRNNLSGPIPLQLLNLTTLTNLSLGQNNFAGTVPAAFSTRFGCSPFDGNPGLLLEDSSCQSISIPKPSIPPKAGDLLPFNNDPSSPAGTPSPEPVPHRRKDSGLSKFTIVALTVGDVALLLMSVATVIMFWIWWKKKDLKCSKVEAGASDSDDSKHSLTSPIKGDSKDYYVSPSRSGGLGPLGSGGGTVSNFVVPTMAPALRPALKSVVGVFPNPDNDMMADNLSIDQSSVYSTEDMETDLVILDSTLSLEFDELLRANAVVLGAGSFGSMFMAALEDGHMLAIKRLEEQALSDERAFGRQCAHLAGVLHPNLLQLKAYCWSPQEKLLIFDFMPYGSVHSNLHGAEAKSPKLKEMVTLYMDWSTRLKIAVGTARALAHLHDHDMVHGNVKASNVLLDEHAEPHLSDFGLEVLLQTEFPLPQHGHDHTIPTSPYLAPEQGISLRHRTQVGDVYSFGVLLLELLTGIDPMGRSNPDLPTWVQEMAGGNRIVEVFDPALVAMHVFPAQDVLEVLKLAQACVSEDASARPSITIVLRGLESIVPGSTAPRSHVLDDDYYSSDDGNT